MTKAYWSSLFLFPLVSIFLALPSPAYNPHRGSSAPSSRIIKVVGMEAPELTSLHLFLNGEPVDQIVSGTKIKNYSMKLAGSGFVSGSNVVVDPFGSITADPYGLEPEVTLATTFKNASALRTVFGHGSSPLPGMLSIKVVNPGGGESNTVTIDVISKASTLSIASISAESGSIGTQVTLTGVGIAPSGNIIRFSPVGFKGSAFVGFYLDTPSDGRTLTFVVPNGDSLVFPGRFNPPPVAFLPITPQQYRLSVINSNGLSNSFLFQVTDN